MYERYIERPPRACCRGASSALRMSCLRPLALIHLSTSLVHVESGQKGRVMFGTLHHHRVLRRTLPNFAQPPCQAGCVLGALPPVTVKHKDAQVAAIGVPMPVRYVQRED